MKMLRVLTGLHAGARISLERGSYRIGPALSGETQDADGDASGDSRNLSLIDWTGPPLMLDLDDDEGQAAGRGQRVRVAPALAPSGRAGVNDDASSLWDDLSPSQFGQIVLCVGDSDSKWPSDLELLSRLRMRNGPAGAVQAVRGKLSRAVAIGLGLLMVAAAPYGRQNDVRHAVRDKPGTPGAAAQQLTALSPGNLRHRLSALGLDELDVRPESAGIIVAGMVRDADEDRAARRLLDEAGRSADTKIVQAWSVADEVAASIDGALRATSIHAEYLGGGRFRLEGVVDEPGRLESLAEQLRGDLGPNVKAIETALEARKVEQVFSAAVSSGDLRYAVRKDGTKTFSAGVAR